MSGESELQQEITPLWTRSDLKAATGKSGPTKTREKRTRILNAMRDNGIEPPDDARLILNKFVDWGKDDGEANIALWAGYIDKTDHARTNEEPFADAEAVEESLVERLGTPAYRRTDLNIDDLVDNITSIARASPVTTLRSEFWADDENARERVRDILNRRMEID